MSKEELFITVFQLIDALEDDGEIEVSGQAFISNGRAIKWAFVVDEELEEIIAVKEFKGREDLIDLFEEEIMNAVEEEIESIKEKIKQSNSGDEGEDQEDRDK